MRGVYAVRSRPDFEAIFPALDAMLDRIPAAASHLLVPEANLLHFLRAIRSVRTETRGSFVRQTYDSTLSWAVRRACIDCWRYWRDRTSFIRLRNQWSNLGSNEQRMVWLAAGAFDDEGVKARDQLRPSLAQSWNLGFETENSLSFAACYESWAKNAATCERFNCLRKTALPRESTPCTWKTNFAKSIPICVMFIVDAPAGLSGCLTLPLWHVDAV